MPASYKLTIKNMTGGPQDYVFFSAPPMVSGGLSGPIYQNVMKAAPRTPSGGVTSFELSSKYYAITGVYDTDGDGGMSVSVSKSVEIELGSKASNGMDIHKGSTIALTVTDKSAVDLGPPTTPGGGKLGCFMLDTAVSGGNNFSFQEAKNNNILVGIANSKNSSIVNAMGTFTPYPNCTYQIQPSACLWVASGERFNAGAIVKVERLSNSQAVDFNVRGENNVTLIHDENNRFIFA